MFPRASWSNLLASSPMSVLGLASSATAIENARTANFAQGTTGAGLLGVGNLIYDNVNTQWIRLLTNSSNNADGAGLASSISVVGWLFNGASYDRPRSAASDGLTTGVPAAGLMLWDGSGFNRWKSNTAGNIASATMPYAALTAEPGEWAIFHSPAADTQATISQAAGGAGVRHVARSVSVTLTNDGAAKSGLITVQLRDGASGAGTVKRQWKFIVPAGDVRGTVENSLNIFGSANTAMTLETTASPGASCTATVNLSGYSTVG